MSTSSNRDRLIELRGRLQLTQTQLAEEIQARTSRPCALRTIQAWEAPPEKPSARPCPDWAIEVVQRISGR